MYQKIIFTMRRSLQQGCLALIGIYQKWVSPFLGNHCRFYPSCSQYAKDAFSTYSFFKAFSLTLYRLMRCQPLCKGGVDLIDDHHAR